MHPVSTRIALAGSVLVMGSVGTVSAVHLQSAPVPTVPNSDVPRALAPLGTPTLPPPPAASPAPVAPPAIAPPAAVPRAGGSGVLGADDLVAIAKAPLKGRLVVPVDDAVRTVVKPVRRLTGPVRDGAGRVELDRPGRDTGSQAVDRLVDRYHARAQRRIGDKFGNAIERRIQRRIADRFEDRFGQSRTRAVRSRYAVDRGRHAADAGDRFTEQRGGNRVVRTGDAAPSWAKEYVGRHRAE